ncbi:hypothetical protein BBF96_07395 [Anoxybacter fermentans]|uniref:Sulfate exporter family transporter n=1 Tax=Anoxybacter fermentans TaxID=1323375 RepID=A0A3Q9HQB8_9FIRM|nr:YeiH family protein [Anoxybacter fermentans]AZR73223.1 hypothetical protein BBF96_07395 [Anoxybacter fermentans]
MDKLIKYIPGLIFTAILAWISMQIQKIDFIAKMHFSSLIIAILLGIFIKNIFKVPQVFEAGIHFTLKKILRLAIILLGFKLSFAEVAQIGGRGLVLVIIVTTCTMIFAVLLGKKLKLGERLSLLIGAGTSICGASAVAAVGPIIDAEEKDTTFAIATVTIFGTIAMFLYPLFYRFFHLPNIFYAVWAGSSIHEVAQVVAAGFAAGEQAGQFATLVKLTRVLLLIPIAVLLGIRQMKKEGAAGKLKKVTIPWFVFGFLAVVIINSIDVLPKNMVNGLVSLDGFLLTWAMAGMGLETSLEKMKKVGIKPFYVGLVTWLFIGTIGFFMSRMLFI